MHSRTFFFPHILPAAQLSACINSSPSQLHEKVRRSNRISECDLSTPWPPPSAFLLLAPVALGGTQEPPGPQGVGLRWWPRGLGSHVLTISSRLLWNYANIFVQFPWVWGANWGCLSIFFSVTAVEQARRRLWSPIIQIWVETFASLRCTQGKALREFKNERESQE